MLLSGLENLISVFISGATLQALQCDSDQFLSGTPLPADWLLLVFEMSKNLDFYFIYEPSQIYVPKSFEENKEKSSAEVGEMLSSGCRWELQKGWEIKLPWHKIFVIKEAQNSCR